MVLMQYISAFFSGFILSQFPSFASEERLPLSPLAIPLDARLQVSSRTRYRHARPGRPLGFVRNVFLTPAFQANDSALSWYFLNLFGLNGVFKLILGQDNGAYCFELPSLCTTDIQPP